jgi:hypothetical protein
VIVVVRAPRARLYSREQECADGEREREREKECVCEREMERERAREKQRKRVRRRRQTAQRERTGKAPRKGAGAWGKMRRRELRLTTQRGRMAGRGKRETRTGACRASADDANATCPRATCDGLGELHGRSLRASACRQHSTFLFGHSAKKCPL